MKKKLLFIALSVFSFWGCSDSSAPEIEEPVKKIENDTVRIISAYWSNAIKMNTGDKLDAITDTADWKKWKRLKMAVTPIAPRNESYSFINPYWGNMHTASMPLEMCMDIERKDGWEIIDHTFNERMWYVDDYSYLIFYNTERKILKVTYYINKFIAHTKGFIKLRYDENKNIFAENNCDTITKENIVSSFDYITGFRLGWNGFEVELKESPRNLNGRFIMDFMFQNIYVYYKKE